ncbi:head decoration protein [Gilliamella sp. CG16]|uniref:head decoration protein n=1 Tax=Gilliamella sp. CG16 TaxID=3351503 RepID=UPI0039885E4F
MQKLDEFKPDNLIAGYMHQTTEQVFLKSGFVYKRGSVLAKTPTGECTLVDSSNADTNEVYGILAHDVDTTNSAQTSRIFGVVYLSGEFNKRELIFGGNDTLEQHIDAARKQGIYFVDTSATTTND